MTSCAGSSSSSSSGAAGGTTAAAGGAEAALLFRRRVARVAPAWQENADALESLLSMAAFAPARSLPSPSDPPVALAARDGGAQEGVAQLVLLQPVAPLRARMGRKWRRRAGKTLTNASQNAFGAACVRTGGHSTRRGSPAPC
mgnify:CR=1 FL=1